MEFSGEVILQDSKENFSTLTWDELNCFIRPQVLICERVQPGAGWILLFLTSLYKSYSVQGCFTDADKGYFHFLTKVFNGLTCVNGQLTRFRDKNDIIKTINSRLSAQHDIIVPGNLNALFYSEFYKREDRGHYFLLTGRDSTTNSYTLLDHLHLQPQGKSTSYLPTSIESDALNALICAYWDVFCGGQGRGASSFHGCTDFWVLEFTHSANKHVLDKDREIIRLYSQTPYYEDKLSNMDKNHINAMNATLVSDGSPTSQNVEEMIRDYLVDVNFSAIHDKILLQSLARLNQASADKLGAIYRQHVNAVTKLRNQFFIKHTLKKATNQCGEHLSLQLTTMKLDYTEQAKSVASSLVKSDYI